jgi:hypothetical protein
MHAFLLRRANSNQSPGYDHHHPPHNIPSIQSPKVLAVILSYLRAPFGFANLAKLLFFLVVVVRANEVFYIYLTCLGLFPPLTILFILLVEHALGLSYYCTQNLINRIVVRANWPQPFDHKAGIGATPIPSRV